MGTQIHAEDNYRRVVELIQAGAIGPVREVHVWVSRAWGWQPSLAEAKRHGDIVAVQNRPSGTAARSRRSQLGTLAWAGALAAVSQHVCPGAQSGTAGGISATARCRTWAATGSICRSGRWGCKRR